MLGTGDIKKALEGLDKMDDMLATLSRIETLMIQIESNTRGEQWGAPTA